MTSQEINIACAELMGWNTTKEVLGGVFIYRDPKGNIAAVLPSYTTSLDACAEAWKTLDRKQRIEFSVILRGVVVRAGGHAASHQEDIDACVANASAQHRSESFLRLHNRWKEKD